MTAQKMKDRPPEPLLLTTAEAARALGISERHLFNLTKNGTIPTVKLGACVRYSAAALRYWIEAQTAPPMRAQD